MSLFSRPAVRDALLFHGLFFAVAIPVALSLSGHALGLALCGFALAYNAMLPAVGARLAHADWVNLWKFLLPLSMALPCADWMLVERMGTLTFPDHGIARIGGAVPVYFMGLWVMLLWQVCWLAQATKRPYASVSVLSLAGFLVWEWAARPMNLWHAQDVRQIAGFALYPLIPEVLLSVAALWAWRTLRHDSLLPRIAVALGLAVFYTGALALSLLWIG